MIYLRYRENPDQRTSVASAMADFDNCRTEPLCDEHDKQAEDLFRQCYVGVVVVFMDPVQGNANTLSDHRHKES